MRLQLFKAQKNKVESSAEDPGRSASPSGLVQSDLTRELNRMFERVQLSSHARSRSSEFGGRRSVKRGESMEFVDYREYSVGDDLRYLDWKAYGRLERLYIKEYSAETNLVVHILVDTSASMYESSGHRKARFAVSFAHGLASGIAAKYHTVRVANFSDRASASISLRQGNRKPTSIRRMFESMHFHGGTNFSSSVTSYCANVRAGDVAVIVSDFMAPDYNRGLRALRARRCDIVCIHTLSSDELRPDIEEPSALKDSESGESVEIANMDEARSLYKASLSGFLNDVSSAVVRVGGQYVFADTGRTVAEILGSEFNTGRILRFGGR